MLQYTDYKHQKWSINSANTLFLSLIKGDLIPNNLWRSIKYRLKFAIRSLLFHKYSFRWFEQLISYGDWQNLLLSQPGLPCRLHRPYLANNLNQREQYQSLVAHYNFVVQQLPKRIKQALYNPYILFAKDNNQDCGYHLTSFMTKKGFCFSIVIVAEDKFNREGELTAVLYNQDKVALARLTFTFTQYQGKSTLFIGGLQGAEASVEHQLIHDATKECHGLFPKRILLDAVRCLAHLLQIEQIIAVSNSTHIYNNWRYTRRKKYFFADYDSFWQSLGGECSAAGYYQLPLEGRQKPLNEISSKKRAEYQRRYQLINELYADLCTRFYSSIHY